MRLQDPTVNGGAQGAKALRASRRGLASGTVGKLIFNESLGCDFEKRSHEDRFHFGIPHL